MDLGLKGKVAIVTGGSRGIGRSIALGLAAEGCDVAICARGEETLRETEKELAALGVRTFAQAVDVMQAGQSEAFVDAAAGALGKLDILVNNAGGNRPGDADDVWSEVVDLNLQSTVRATRAAVAHMKSNGSGSIIHIASVFGREAGGGAPYMTTKAAVIAHAKSLALSLASQGIRVNSVAPGSVSFPGGSWYRRQQEDPEGMERFVAQNIASGRFGKAEEIADVVVFLASERASWITGACINVDGGQSKSLI
jgi:3-oxoacyl-[acyl-carrier protein] reductase